MNNLKGNTLLMMVFLSAMDLGEAYCRMMRLRRLGLSSPKMLMSRAGFLTSPFSRRRGGVDPLAGSIIVTFPCQSCPRTNDW